MTVGEIDLRCAGPTNEAPKLTPEQALARTWRPDDASWSAIKQLFRSRLILLLMALLKPTRLAQIPLIGMQIVVFPTLIILSVWSCRASGPTHS